MHYWLQGEAGGTTIEACGAFSGIKAMLSYLFYMFLCYGISYCFHISVKISEIVVLSHSYLNCSLTDAKDLWWNTQFINFFSFPHLQIRVKIQSQCECWDLNSFMDNSAERSRLKKWKHVILGNTLQSFIQPAARINWCALPKCS